MVRTVRHGVFPLLLLALWALQFMGTPCSNDCQRVSPSPLQAHDQVPGSPDGEAEGDQGESELEELAFAQGEAVRIIELART